MSKIGIFNFKLQTEHVDFTGHVSMCTLAGIVMHCAGENAKENGFGIDDLMKYGNTWVLSRMAIDMTRFPVLGENIVAHTWIEENYDFMSDRKIVFYDQANNIIGYASTIWAVLNVETRKPQPLAEIHGIGETPLGTRGFDIDIAARIRCTDSVDVETRNVRYSDLDINNHVTSVKYIEWVYDAVGVETLKDKQFLSMVVNYQNEVLYGEKVSIRLSPSKPYHFDIYSPAGVNTTKIRLS